MQKNIIHELEYTETVDTGPEDEYKLPKEVYPQVR